MLRVLAGASLLGVVLLASSPARADDGPGAPPPKELTLTDGMRIPSGYTLVERTRTGPIVAGAVTFGTSYLTAVAAAAFASLSGDGRATTNLLVPVLGPLLQMDRAGADLGTLILATNAIAQGVGAGLLIYGIFSKKQVLVRDELVVTPMITGSSAGLGVSGTF